MINDYKRLDIPERTSLKLLSIGSPPLDVYQTVAVKAPFPSHNEAETLPAQGFPIRRGTIIDPTLGTLDSFFPLSLPVGPLFHNFHHHYPRFIFTWTAAHIAQAPHYPIHQYHQVQQSYYSLFSLFYRE